MASTPEQHQLASLLAAASTPGQVLDRKDLLINSNRDRYLLESLGFSSPSPMTTKSTSPLNSTVTDDEESVEIGVVEERSFDYRPQEAMFASIAGAGASSEQEQSFKGEDEVSCWVWF